MIYINVNVINYSKNNIIWAHFEFKLGLISIGNKLNTGCGKNTSLILEANKSKPGSMYLPQYSDGYAYIS